MKNQNFIPKPIASFLMALTFLLVSVIHALGQCNNLQILGVHQVVDGTQAQPAFHGLIVTFQYFNPPGGTPIFLNICAQAVGGNTFAWVAKNIYLNTFPNQRTLNRSISLSELDILEDQRIPAINLAIVCTNQAVTGQINPGQFINYNCPVDSFYIFDGIVLDSAGPGGGAQHEALDFGGPIQASVTRACNVPNVDLDNATHPPGGTYAGDQNACGPASVANSLSWIESSDPNIGTDGLTERQRLEELSGLMNRPKGGGVKPEDIVQAKISFAANHDLKLKVEYLGASGNFKDDVKWLQDQYNLNQDIELDYSYVQDGQTKSHAVVVTDLQITGSVPQISFKDDTDQKKKDPTKTGETPIELREGNKGALTFIRNGIVCTINNMYAESYDANAGTYVDPNTGGSSVAFCKKVSNKCQGACPALIAFYGPDQTPLITYPVCDPVGCCSINKLYTDASGACGLKKKGCKGNCNPIYRSKSDAAKGANPVQGECSDLTGCKCLYDLKGKFKRARNDSEEILSPGILKIFPNPATQQINIRVTYYKGIVQLQLSNVLGQQMISKTIELKGEEFYTIDISSFAKGLYKVALSNETTVSRGSFVKE